MNDHKGPPKFATPEDSKAVQELLNKALHLATIEDYKGAFALYQKAAEQGSAVAFFELGTLVASGLGVPKDSKKAAEYYQKSAEKGYAPAQFTLCHMYRKGDGVEINLTKAFELMSLAAKQNLAEAESALGYMYEKGIGVVQNANLAVAYYHRAAEKGIDTAYFNLGLCYQQGYGIEKDEKKAVYFYRQALDRNILFAASNLLEMYKQGLCKPEIIYHLALYAKENRMVGKKEKSIIDQFLVLAKNEFSDPEQPGSLFYRLLAEFPQDLERIKKHFPTVYNSYLSSSIEIAAALKTETPLPPPIQNIILDSLMSEPESTVVKNKIAKIRENESTVKSREEALKLTGATDKAKLAAQKVGETVEDVKKRVAEAHLKAARLLGDLSFLSPDEAKSKTSQEHPLKNPLTADKTTKPAPKKPLSKN